MVQYETPPHGLAAGTTAVWTIIALMPQYSPDTKSAARAGQEAAEWTRSISGALGIEGNHRYLYAAAFFDLLARVAGRISEDPPRKDFATSTHVRPRFAKPDYISTDAPFEQLALEAADSADDAERHLAAHLRAFERFQGALKADRGAEADQRIEEARMQARLSSRALRRVANPVSGIADQLAAAEPGELARSDRRGRPHIGDVSEEALAILFLGGLRIRDLENVLRGTRLEDANGAARQLRSAAESFRDFAAQMADWTPPTETDLVL